MSLVRLSMSIAVLLCLAACKPPEKTPPEKASASAPAVSSIAAASWSAAPSSSSPSGTAGDASHDRDALQCDQQVGATAAKHLADRCLMVSPASHPPCNIANSCAVIRAEIKRSCDILGPKESWPKECTR